MIVQASRISKKQLQVTEVPLAAKKMGSDSHKQVEETIKSPCADRGQELANHAIGDDQPQSSGQRPFKDTAGWCLFIPQEFRGVNRCHKAGHVPSGDNILGIRLDPHDGIMKGHIHLGIGDQNCCAVKVETGQEKSPLQYIKHTGDYWCHARP